MRSRISKNAACENGKLQNFPKLSVLGLLIFKYGQANVTRYINVMTCACCKQMRSGWQTKGYMGFVNM